MSVALEPACAHLDAVPPRSARTTPAVLHKVTQAGALVCLDYATGHVRWQQGLGAGSLLAVDGMPVARSGQERVFLRRCKPARFELLGELQQPDHSGRTNDPHPVIPDGRLYLRDQDRIVCYDLRARNRS